MQSGKQIAIPISSCMAVPAGIFINSAVERSPQDTPGNIVAGTGRRNGQLINAPDLCVSARSSCTTHHDATRRGRARCRAKQREIGSTGYRRLKIWAKVAAGVAGVDPPPLKTRRCRVSSRFGSSAVFLDEGRVEEVRRGDVEGLEAGHAWAWSHSHRRGGTIRHWCADGCGDEADEGKIFEHDELLLASRFPGKQGREKL